MFSDIIPHGTKSKLCIYIDLTYHAFLGPAKSAYCQQRSACHVQRSAQLESLLTHDHNDVTMQT